MKNSYITATDQFCGAGGSTTGAKAAGVEVKMALNHCRPDITYQGTSVETFVLPTLLVVGLVGQIHLSSC